MRRDRLLSTFSRSGGQGSFFQPLSMLETSQENAFSSNNHRREVSTTTPVFFVVGQPVFFHQWTVFWKKWSLARPSFKRLGRGEMGALNRLSQKDQCDDQESSPDLHHWLLDVELLDRCCFFPLAGQTGVPFWVHVLSLKIKGFNKALQMAS